MSSIPLDDGAGQWAIDAARPFDVGGASELMGAPLNLEEKRLARWEVETHALLASLLANSKMKVDELRSGIELLDPNRYDSWSYYDKWAASIATAALARGLATEDQLYGALGEHSLPQEPLFRQGDIVRVKPDNSKLCGWRKPHVRVPGYVFGAVGVVDKYRGSYPDPHFLAFRATATEQPLYTVTFSHAALGWGDDDAFVTAEVYQGWLDEADPADLLIKSSSPTHVHLDESSGDHDHQHDHEHHSRYETERLAVESQEPEAPGERLVGALVEVLSQNGHLDMSRLRAAAEAVEKLCQPMTAESIGPRVVARAWKDPDFKRRLIDDAQAAIKDEFDFDATNATAPTKLVAVMDQAKLKHVAVCTLCSCYPISVLGVSPAWYKDVKFRARAVREPRRLLKDDFGIDLDPDTQIKVVDSTADCRYLVIPVPPPDVQSATEAELASRVTRDSMIGVGLLS